MVYVSIIIAYAVLMITYFINTFHLCFCFFLSLQDDNWGENTTAVSAATDLDYGSPGSFGVAGGVSGLNVLDGAPGHPNSGNPGGPGAGSASVVTGGIGNPGDMDNTKWGNTGVRGIETGRGFGFRCKRHAGPIVAGLLSIFAFVSPILMVGLPKMNFGLVQLSEKKENEVIIEDIFVISRNSRFLTLFFKDLL